MQSFMHAMTNFSALLSKFNKGFPNSTHCFHEHQIDDKHKRGYEIETFDGFLPSQLD